MLHPQLLTRNRVFPMAPDKVVPRLAAPPWVPEELVAPVWSIDSNSLRNC